MFYQVKVRIEPSMNFIEVKVKMKHPPEPRFLLNKNMQIKRIFAEGKDVSFQINDSMPNAMEVAVEVSNPDDLEIEYSGTISETIAQVNLISSNLIELALYSNWFPQFRGGGQFAFHLDIDLPEGFDTETNGVLKVMKKSGSRYITSWESLKPAFDIALVASPDFKKLEMTRDDKTVEIYYDQLPRKHVENMASNLLNARKMLENIYGEASEKEKIKVIYSPRDGWGYVRSTLILIGENRSIVQSRDKFGQMMDFRYITHEISHFWWRLADINTPDDWINEGLADFSAFRVVKGIWGDEFADGITKSYKEHALNSKTETPIAETGSSSPDREVNRYDKSALMFIEAQKRFGTDKLDQFLRSLHLRFKETINLTTGIFLEEAEKQMGTEAKEFFSKILYAKQWQGFDIMGL